MKTVVLLFALAGAVIATGIIAPVGALAASEDARQWQTFRQTDSEKVVPKVKAIQFLLRARGFYPSQPDGIYGPRTAAAVKAFQRKHGLKVDGIVGPQTFPKLVKTLRRGDRGDAVRAVQTLLRLVSGHSAQTPYTNLPVDGIYGPQTEDAVRDAQHLNNWFEERGPENGVTGLVTWKALFDDAGHP